MELSYKEEVSVGALVIVGLIAFTVGMFWLTGRSTTTAVVSASVSILLLDVVITQLLLGVK